jgi:hypothetical protein
MFTDHHPAILVNRLKGDERGRTRGFAAAWVSIEASQD